MSDLEVGKDPFFSEVELVSWYNEDGKSFVYYDHDVNFGSLVKICYQGVWRFFDKKRHQVVFFTTKKGDIFFDIEGPTYDFGHMIEIERGGKRLLFDKTTHKEV